MDPKQQTFFSYWDAKEGLALLSVPYYLWGMLICPGQVVPAKYLMMSCGLITVLSTINDMVQVHIMHQIYHKTDVDRCKIPKYKSCNGNKYALVSLYMATNERLKYYMFIIHKP